MFSYKKWVNTLVFIISILTVNLITDRITNFLLLHKHITSAPKATLLGMGIMVIVLYPCFLWIDDWSEKLTKRYLNVGKNAAGRFLGVLLAFTFAIAILFCFYLNLWFGKYPWDLV